MRGPYQFTIAGVMMLVLFVGVVLAVLRDPIIGPALTGFAISGLLFVSLWLLIYFCTGCIYLAIWLFHRLMPRQWTRRRASTISGPSSSVRN